MKRTFESQSVVETLESQDDIVVAYIEALEVGDNKAAELLKLRITHFSEKTEFDFSVLETIAIYANLLNKTNASKALKAQEPLLADFVMPTNNIVMLCAARYGYTNIMKLVLTKDLINWDLVKKAIFLTVEHSHLSAMQFLLSANMIDGEMNHNLMKLALKHHNIDALKDLLSLRVSQKSGNIPLYLPSISQSISIMRSLAAANIAVKDVIFTKNIDGLLNATFTMLQPICVKIMTQTNVTWDDVILETISRALQVCKGDIQHTVSFLASCGEVKWFEKVAHEIDFPKYAQHVLPVAVRNGDFEMVKHLFSYGITFELGVMQHLMASIVNDDVNIFKYLFEVAKSEITQYDQTLLLKEIAVKDAIKIAKFLVSCGLNLALVDEDMFVRLVAKNSVQTLKYFVSMNVDIQPFVLKSMGLIFNTHQCDLYRYLFEFLGENDFLNPKVITAAIDVQDVQSLRVLVAKGAKIDNYITKEMILWRSYSLEMVQFLASKRFNIVDNSLEFVKRATGQQDYHINWYLSSSLKIDVSSIIEKAAGHSIALFNAQSSISYIKRMNELEQNVNPFLRDIDPERDNILRIVNEKCNAIFEMLYCAMECPTEVLSLIASQMLGFNCSIFDLMAPGGLSKIHMPREIECSKLEQFGPSKAALKLQLLYERNQIANSTSASM